MKRIISLTLAILMCLSFSTALAADTQPTDLSQWILADNLPYALEGDYIQVSKDTDGDGKIEKHGLIDSSAKEIIPLVYDTLFVSDGTPEKPQSTATQTATPTKSAVLVNGKSVSFDAYSINDNNYFKLRDLAQALSGTEKQFDVTWDSEKQAINLISNKPYTAVGGELSKGDGARKTAQLSASAILLNGQAVQMTAYTINENNYFKLRDIGETFDFSVIWDGAQNTIVIDTAKGYTKDPMPISTEERLYEVIKCGIENKVGLPFVESASADNYIDLSEFGLSNEDGSEGRELLRRAFKDVFYENPQFFYLRESYQRKRSGSSLAGVIPMYYELFEEESVLKEYEATFQAAVEEAMKQVEGVTDPVEQLLILHDYLVQTNLYNWEIAADHENWDPWWARTAYGAMTGDCVCKGYALAYKLLLNNLGFHSAIAVNGTGSHLWNIVELDGEWYHIDVTQDSPFPTLSGRCRHDYFLVSEEKLQSLNGNHKDWEAFGKNSGGISCTSIKYESGWAFNNQVYFTMYQKDGAFYYITRNSNGKYILYQGSLSESGKKVTEIPIYIHSKRVASGVAWVGDSLYYVNSSQNLVCLHLSSGKATSIGKIAFTPAPSQDGLSSAEQDGIGLRYDKETGELVALSSTRRVDLGHFSIISPD